MILQNIATSPNNAACYEESESVRRIPNRPVELEMRMSEEFWGSRWDQPVCVLYALYERTEIALYLLLKNMEVEIEIHNLVCKSQ